MAIAEPPVLPAIIETPISDTPLTDEIEKLWPPEMFLQRRTFNDDRSQACILGFSIICSKSFPRLYRFLNDAWMYRNDKGLWSLSFLNDWRTRDAVLAALREYERSR